MAQKIETRELDLHDFALSILKVPERVERLNIIQLKELSIFLKKRKEGIVSYIFRQISIIDEREYVDKEYHYNYPEKYLPDKLFEYWAERYGQGSLGGYYNVIYLQNIIVNRQSELNSKKELNDYKYSETFTQNGFGFFEILNKVCNLPKYKKYSQIFWFMNYKTEYLKSNKKSIFIRFLNEYLPKVNTLAKEKKIDKLYNNNYEHEFEYGKEEYDAMWKEIFHNSFKNYFKISP